MLEILGLNCIRSAWFGMLSTPEIYRENLLPWVVTILRLGLR